VNLKYIVLIDCTNLNRNTSVLHWGREDRLQRRKLTIFYFVFNAIFVSCSVANA
jgi:hypothetical protein